MRTRKKNKVWHVVLAVVLVALISAVAVLAVQMNKQITTKTLSSAAYSVGSLGEDGRAINSDEHIYTKDYVTTDGLKVELAEKADIQYKLYFYGEDKAFKSASDWLTADFNGSIPEGAAFVRIVIDPIDDAEVSLFEIVGYANQLTVTFNR